MAEAMTCMFTVASSVTCGMKVATCLATSCAATRRPGHTRLGPISVTSALP